MLVLCQANRNNPHPELEVYENCVVRVEGRQLFSKEHLNRIRFDSHGLASALIGDQHFYIKPDGAMLAVIPFDNGPDYFSEGLTRSVVNGKMAWFNRRFDEVIPPGTIGDGPLKGKGPCLQRLFRRAIRRQWPFTDH